MQSWVLLIMALSMNSLANVLIKIGAKSPGPIDDNSSSIQKMFTFLNLPTILAMFFFACNIFVYRKALEGISNFRLGFYMRHIEKNYKIR